MALACTYLVLITICLGFADVVVFVLLMLLLLLFCSMSFLVLIDPLGIRLMLVSNH